MSNEAAGEPSPESSDRALPAGVRVPWGLPAVLVAAMLWYLLLNLFYIQFGDLLEARLPPEQWQALAVPIGSLMLAAVTVAYVGLSYRGAARRLIGSQPFTKRAVWYGLGAGFVGLVVFAIGIGALLQWVAALFDQSLPPVQEEFRRLAATPAAPILAVGAIFFAPLGEELFFRGLLFSALRRHVPLWPAMGLSAATFALFHWEGGNLEGTLVVLLITFPFGMLLAYVYARTNSLLAPMLGHAVFNLVQVLELIRQGAV